MSDRPIIVVGPGARFLSGISYYTARLARAFAESGHPVAVVLVRRLCPERIYPGRERIGTHPDGVLGLDGIATATGLDWFGGPGTVRALWFLARRRPRVVVLQWWTGTIAHLYLLVAVVTRLVGGRVVLEFHETVDVGEAAVPGVRRYVRTMMRGLARLASGAVVHSNQDAEAVRAEFAGIDRLPTAVIHHGPFDHLVIPRTPSAGPVRFVFFGVLRTYKGLDELAAAFSSLLASGRDVHLTVAGEPWPESDTALDALRALPADRVRLTLGHLPDDELAAVIGAADIIVLPYRRSSASGPLHIAMAAGLPVVTTAVPALVEVTAGYAGAVLAAPHDAVSLAAAMERAVDLVGTRHADPHSWPRNVERYLALFARTTSEA